MARATHEFWQLLGDSGLLHPDECRAVGMLFARERPGELDANVLAGWLQDKRILSAYQVRLLLAGKAGPFVYGPYKVHEKIKEGPLAGLFRARHATSKHGVLLQFLTEDDSEADWPGRYQAFCRWQPVQHPAVVACHALVHLDLYRFYVLQDVSGQTLSTRLISKEPLKFSVMCAAAQHLAMGLAEIHARRLVHGEICLENILVDDQDRMLWLGLPFVHSGIAPTIEERIDYLAPELVKADSAGPGTPESDMYALGCVLYRLLSNRFPFQSGDLDRKKLRHQREEPQALITRNPKLPEPICDLVMRMLAKNPSRRPKHLDEVAHILSTRSGQLEEFRTPETLPAFLEAVAREAGPAGAVFLGQNAAPAVATAMPMVPQAGLLLPGQVGPMPGPVLPGAMLPGGIPVAGAVVPGAFPTAFGVPAAMVAAPVAAAGIPMGQPAYAGTSFNGISPGGTLEEQFAAGAAGASGSDAPLVQSRERSRSRRRGNKWLLPAGILAVALAMVGITWAVLQLNNQTTNAAGEGNTPNAGENAGGPAPNSGGNASSGSTNAGNAAAGSGTVAANNGGTLPGGSAGTNPNKGAVARALEGELWPRPTSGAPIALHYIPAGVQMVISLRPAQLMDHPEGPKVWESLGPLGLWTEEHVEQLSGLRLEDIDWLVIAAFDRGEAVPGLSFVVRPVESMERSSVTDAWADAESANENDRKIYRRAGHAYFFVSPDTPTTFAVVPEAELESALAAISKPALVPLELEKLAATSDREWHFCLITTTNFVNSGAAALFTGDWERVKDPLRTFLGDDVKALMLGMHVSDEFFTEMQIIGQGTESPEDLARAIRSRIKRLPEQVERYVSSLALTPYARNVLFRFPSQVRAWEQYTQAGVWDKRPLFRAILPDIAAHNLVLGSQLAMTEPMGDGTGTAAAGTPGTKKSLAERLKVVTSLTFPRDTLENAIALLAEASGISMTIVGKDLELKSITKNQSFGIDLKDKPVSEILDAVLMKADPAGNLTYVVAKENGAEVLLITTKDKAAERGEAIAAE